jgi:hypothetical protein
MEEKLSEIINLVNAKDSSYKTKSIELMQIYKTIDKKSETSEIQLNAILLNFLIGNYNFYGFNFNLISKETKDAIQKLMKALYENVLPNAYPLFDSIKTGKEKLNPLLIEACKKTYKQKQIDFIRRFYSKILYKNLKDFFPINEIDKIVAEEGWIKEKEYILPTEKNSTPEFNVGKEIEDIKYINDMNVQFNKLIKEHEHLVNFLNSNLNKQ